MGSKDVQSQGTGGAFKVEKNAKGFERAKGNRACLDRYGSLGHVIESVLQSGAYISFGTTTDGGSVLVRVLDGDSKLSSYCHSNNEFMEAMEALEDRYKRGGKPLPLFTATDTA